MEFIIIGGIIFIIALGILGLAGSLSNSEENEGKENINNKPANSDLDNEEKYPEDIENSHPEDLYPQKILCYYCFEEFGEDEALFKCINPNCIKISDEKYQEFWDTDEKINYIFEGGDKVYKAKCPECGTPTTVRVCPHCHNELIIITS